MAIGDVAAAAGLVVYAGTQDIRLGYQNDNQRGDELGTHLISGTHPASAINSGTLDLARIPTLDAGRVPALDASKITTGALGADRIPGLDGAKIVSGAVHPDRLTYLYGANIWGNIDVGTNGGGNVRGQNFVTPGDLIAVGVRTRALSSWTSVVTNSSGYLGYGSSNRASKQNIVPTAIPTDVALDVKVVDFYYRSDVKEFGENAPLNIGVIAEQIEEIGLGQLVNYDDAGKVRGVHYERLALVLFPLVQKQAAQITALEARLEALETSK